VDARVVIPTWNGGAQLRELLRALKAQKPASVLREIVVVDSSSSDGSANVARDEGARVIPIDRATFNHGATRNLGAADATAAAVVFLVQDALPVGDSFLAALLEPLGEPGVAASYARVVARLGASATVRRDVARDLVAGEAQLVKRMPDRTEWDRWSASQRRVHCHFNDVASAIRADAFRALPFRALAFGEDLDWGKRALEAGHAIAFAPRAVVAHSHRSSWSRDFRRHRDDGSLEAALFGIRRAPSFARALVRAARAVAVDLSSPPRAFAPALRLAQALGRWSGGKRPLSLPS